MSKISTNIKHFVLVTWEEIVQLTALHPVYKHPLQTTHYYVFIQIYIELIRPPIYLGKPHPQHAVSSSRNNQNIHKRPDKRPFSPCVY